VDSLDAAERSTVVSPKFREEACFLQWRKFEPQVDHTDEVFAEQKATE
jgi:hypothetical protein